jgi:thiol:disulfide interchange protein DsbA
MTALSNTKPQFEQPSRSSGMNRRLFFAATAAWTIEALCSPPDGGWKAGVHYVVLPIVQPTSASIGTIEVVEAFSYTCIHCFHFEPYLRSWLEKAPKYVRFLRLPSLWDEQHRAHAQLYYTLQILGRNDLDDTVFHTIHVDKNPLFSSESQITFSQQLAFARSHRIGEREFTSAYESATVKSRMDTDAQFLTRFQIAETPAMVIDGKFMTDETRVGASEFHPETAMDRLIELTDALVAIQRKASQLSAA